MQPAGQQPLCATRAAPGRVKSSGRHAPEQGGCRCGARRPASRSNGARRTSWVHRKGGGSGRRARPGPPPVLAPTGETAAVWTQLGDAHADGGLGGHCPRR
eukprot:16434808-Heterocapsa_arctica.AAC.1